MTSPYTSETPSSLIYITLLFLELIAHFGLLEEISVLEGEEYYMHALPEFEDLKYGTI
jgi:hypothetical protein